MFDERGNVNNVIEVQEYQPENLDNLTSFQPPSSPTSSYDNVRRHPPGPWAPVRTRARLRGGAPTRSHAHPHGLPPPPPAHSRRRCRTTFRRSRLQRRRSCTSRC